jgi:hypothetical protein
MRAPKRLGSIFLGLTAGSTVDRDLALLETGLVKLTTVVASLLFCLNCDSAVTR